MRRLLRAFINARYEDAIVAQTNYDRAVALYGDDALYTHRARLHTEISWLKADMWRTILWGLAWKGDPND